MCGENGEPCKPYHAAYGSPPRVRGKRYSFTFEDWEWRITPACAGKTALIPRSDFHGADHPRVCGENTGSVDKVTWETGSPPRVRGKHFGNGVFPWLILVLSLDPL